MMEEYGSYSGLQSRTREIVTSKSGMVNFDKMGRNGRSEFYPDAMAGLKNVYAVPAVDDEEEAGVSYVGTAATLKRGSAAGQDQPPQGRRA